MWPRPTESMCWTPWICRSLLIFATSAEVKASGLLTTAYTVTDGAVYVYFTVNGPRGEIVVLKDTGRR